VCLLVTRVLPSVWAVVFGAGAMTLSLYTLHVVLRTPGFFPDDNMETFALHVAIVLIVGALFRLAGQGGPLERMTANLAGAARRSVLTP
jgi:tellurite resistance protein TehA-like permease